jgi:hypothetical protein
MTKNVLLLSLYVFVANAIAFILFFELYLYGDPRCDMCGNFVEYDDWWPRFFRNLRQVYAFYLTLILFGSVVYGYCYRIFKLYERINGEQIVRWIVLLLMIFAVGLVFYGAIVFRSRIWSKYSYGHWMLLVCLSFIGDVIAEEMHFKICILIGIVTAIVTMCYLRFWSNDLA